MAHEKKAFQKQCRILYYGRRMHLAKALNDLKQDTEDKTLQGFFDRDRVLAGEVPFPLGAQRMDKGRMSDLLEVYRDKLFPFHKLDEFLPPNDMSDNDILNLMKVTGKIKQGEKVYEPFAEYLKQRAIYEQKYGEWKTKKAARMRSTNKKKRTDETFQRVVTNNLDLL